MSEPRDEHEPKPSTEGAETEATGASPDAADAASARPEAVAADAADDDAGAGENAEGEGEGAIDDIARRADALGGDDALEAVARDEEKKLAARRAAGGKKGKKKGGLEVAASKRLSEIGAKKAAQRAASPRAAAAVDADPVLERTEKLSEWVQKNQKVVAGVVAAAVLVVGGALGWSSWQRRTEERASSELAKAVAAERGTVRPGKVDPEEAARDPRPTFGTVKERRDAALAKYRAVSSAYPGTGAAMLARLSEGSLLLDERDVDGALQAFEDVKASPLAAADAEVRGRALEGLGFAWELKAASDPAAWDKALETYKALETGVDVKGWKELAMYHQARVHLAKGEKDKAKELLVSVRERTSKPDDTKKIHPQLTPAFPYLKEVATDRLREIAPEAVPPKASGGPMGMPGMQGMPGGAGGHGGMDQEQLRRLIEQMQQRQKQSGGGGPQ